MLNAASIRETADRIANAAGKPTGPLSKLFDLVQWAIQLPAEARQSLQRPDQNTPQWDEALFPAQTLDEARRKYELGDRLALRIPICVNMRKGDDVERRWSYFDAYLERDATLPKADEHYIRKGIRIPGIPGVGDRGVRGFIVVEDDPLASLLGDAENPAHTDWVERERRVKQRYYHGASAVRFVRSSLRSLVALLTKPAQGVDEDLLKDLFFVDVPESEGEKEAAKKKEKDGEPPPPPEPPTSHPPPLHVHATAGGFRIRKNPKAATVPPAVRVHVAYEVRRGNPFRRYDPLDFELDKPPIAIQASGATVTKSQRNELEFTATAADFELTATGFDPHRDIRVRVIPLTGGGEQ